MLLRELLLCSTNVICSRHLTAPRPPGHYHSEKESPFLPMRACSAYRSLTEAVFSPELHCKRETSMQTEIRLTKTTTSVFRGQFPVLEWKLLFGLKTMDLNITTSSSPARAFRARCSWLPVTNEVKFPAQFAQRRRKSVCPTLKPFSGNH